MYEAKALLNGANYSTSLSSASGHLLMADEPETAGGLNKGPSPQELLAASLACCTTITLKMYAGRKGWLLSEVAADVKVIYTDHKPSIERSIKLGGQLDGEQRARLLQIANSCPIHKLLTSTIEINTRLE